MHLNEHKEKIAVACEVSFLYIIKMMSGDNATIRLLLTVLYRKVQPDDYPIEHFSVNQGDIPIFGVFRQNPGLP
jgi:hypothetical protein